MRLILLFVGVCCLLSAHAATFPAVPNNNTVQLAYDASRASGVAPLAVFFDASNTKSADTTIPFHVIEYTWNFGDSAANWLYGNKTSKNQASGPVAAHVYESPGTYTACVTATDGTHAVSGPVCQTIVVLDPDVVFSGKTYCVSVSGVFTGCPAGVAEDHKVTNSSFPSAVAAVIGTGNVRILFRGGETFSAATTATIGATKTGPGLIGSFGTGKAVVQMTGNTDVLVTNANDWRFQDLDIDLQSGTAARAVHPSVVTAKQLTYLRLSIYNGHNGFTFSDASGTNWDQVFIADSVVSGIEFGGSGGYGVYLSSKRFALLGSSVTTGPSVEHTLRFPFLDKAVVSSNTLTNLTSGKHIIKLHAPDWLVYPVYTQDVVVSDNVLNGGASAWLFPIKPQTNTGTTQERIRNVIVERNFIAAGSSATQGIQVSATFVTIRNNLFEFSLAADTTAVEVDVYGGTGMETPNAVAAYNNTIFDASSRSGMRLFLLGATPTNVTIQNNLGYAPASSGAVMISSAGAVPTVGGNSSDAQVKSSNPLFATTPPVVPADFKPTAGSYAIGGGVAVPVWSDFFLVTEPATRDIGAVVH